MSKFQHVNFKDVNEFLDYLPDDELELVLVLRKMIMEVMPHAEEKLAYNVPFFYGHSRMVFIWPGAIPWGGLRAPGVQLGFCKGNQMPSRDLLEQGDRKEVYSLHFQNLTEIDPEFVRMMLMEALEVDQSEFENKRRNKSKGQN